MNPPINVKLHSPTITIPNWSSAEKEWQNLNSEAQGNPGFFPLTIKFAYVFGIIDDACESVTRLLSDRNFARSVGYVPAYGIFASSIELLGRCVSGESDGSKSCLRPGLQWLKKPDIALYSSVKNADVVARTSVRAYTLEELRDMRNFAAHGQAVSRFYQVDFELLDVLRPCLANAFETYWSALNASDDACNRLAAANIIPVRGWPVFKAWRLFQGDATTGNQSITGLLNRFNWNLSSA